MRNYAGHRLAPWLAHVMVSRQETARPLLTPGEVMQLDPADELVLVSGHPPVRAKKLRYYEDPVFTARVLPAPPVGAPPYPDRPEQRPHDWLEQVRTSDARLNSGDGGGHTDDTGGLEQARHPAREIEPAIQPEAEVVNALGFTEDDVDDVAERRAMDRAQAASAVRTVYAIDAGSNRPDQLQLDI